MTTPKAGDRVRVEFETTVRDVLEGSCRVLLDDGPAFGSSIIRPEHCTVITPPVKVGDRVTAENVGQLPYGSVVLGYAGTVAVRTVDDWQTTTIYGTRGVVSPPSLMTTLRATVLHIPEASA